MSFPAAGFFDVVVGLASFDLVMWSGRMKQATLIINRINE